MGCKDSGRAGRELLKVQLAACKKIELEASCASLLCGDQEAQRGERDEQGAAGCSWFDRNSVLYR